MHFPGHALVDQTGAEQWVVAGGLGNDLTLWWTCDYSTFAAMARGGWRAHDRTLVRACHDMIVGPFYWRLGQTSRSTLCRFWIDQV